MSVPRDEAATRVPDAPVPLLSANDPAPVRILNPDGGSPFLLAGDHAGRAVPAVLHDLGLPEAELARHIGWDIGTAGLAAHLAALLDATAILQNYSRLVIDCNRPPGHPTSIAAVSDGTTIPGNQNLSPAQRQAREQAIFWPYQDQIAQTLAARAARPAPPVLISLHSFTPVFQGQVRNCQIGMLHDRDPRLALALGRLLRARTTFVIADNEPYALDQLTDFTVPRHGEQGGIASLEIEIRQDLIADSAGQAEIAATLARLLPQALGEITF